MYKTKEIEELSIKLEAGEISRSECLSILSRINFDRLQLRERCEALITLEYVEAAKRRSKLFDKEPVKTDAFLQLKDAWNNARPLCNSKVIELIKFTKAYESGLIDKSKVESLNIEQPLTFSEAMQNLKSLVL